MTSLAHVKVDARERDGIVCLGEILMQVKKNKTRKSYIDLYTCGYVILVVVDCQKTANSRLTFPWSNACSIALTDFFLHTELSVHRLVSVKNANFVVHCT